MESNESLQQVLDFIAGGIQNTSNCSSQLLLLLVLLEEVYEARGAIPLLTEKKVTVQSIIRYYRFIITYVKWKCIWNRCISESYSSNL